MIRIVLAGLADDDWRPFRQPQWMAEVRRRPELAASPRHFLDIDEAAYRDCLDGWAASEAGRSESPALERLRAFGAVEIAPG